MSKTTKSTKPRSLAGPSSSPAAAQPDFDVVLGLIEAARMRAVTAVNTTLIDLYWNIGEYISGKIAAEEWGKGTVAALAETIQRRYPGVAGYSPQNLWRMRQFFETYRYQAKLSALLRELSWTHNLLIVGKCKREVEREFYLRVAASQKWKSRELERQINGALFERTVLSPPKLSPVVRELYQTRMPDKKLLQAKLHDFYQLAESEAAALKNTAAILAPPSVQLPAAKKRKPSAKNRQKKGRQK
jgi:predicted nuclease of restriction endonuclease-like (RecB) superfamily